MYDKLVLSRKREAPLLRVVVERAAPLHHLPQYMDVVLPRCSLLRLPAVIAHNAARVLLTTEVDELRVPVLGLHRPTIPAPNRVSQSDHGASKSLMAHRGWLVDTVESGLVLEVGSTCTIALLYNPNWLPTIGTVNNMDATKHPLTKRIIS